MDTSIQDHKYLGLELQPDRMKLGVTKSLVSNCLVPIDTVLTVFNVHLTQIRVIWEVGISVEKISLTTLACR